MLLTHRGFVCRCDDCEDDALRMLPCPRCHARDEHGLLQRQAAEGYISRVGSRAACHAWRCSECGLESDDHYVDTPCSTPAPDDTGWLGSEGRAWPLPLPSGGLFEWEMALEDATIRMRDRAERARKAPWDAASAAGELAGLATLIAAVRAVLGDRHWVHFAMCAPPLELTPWSAPCAD